MTESSVVDGLSSAVDNIEQHCDVKVDVHRKSSSASSEPAIVALDHQPDKISRQSVVKSTVPPTRTFPCSSKSDVIRFPLFIQGKSYADGGSFTPEAMTSLKSEEAERAQRTCLRPSTGGRRFSNISNLAFELSSTTISAPRLQGGGSLELGFVLEDGPAQLTSKNTSRPSGAGGLSSVRRTLSALETSTGSADPSSTASAPQ